VREGGESGTGTASALPQRKMPGSPARSPVQSVPKRDAGLDREVRERLDRASVVDMRYLQ
jgi:hypothetical protein